MKLKNILKKQGGSKLLKQYWQSGVFFTAAAEFLLLGKSRTALEILRLSAQLKSKKKKASTSSVRGPSWSDTEKFSMIWVSRLFSCSAVDAVRFNSSVM